MGYADRDYYRETSARHPSRLAGAPVVKWLLTLNIGIFFFDLLFEAGMVEYGAFSVATGFEKLQVWRILTFQFFHSDFGHLLFNMIGLLAFGPMVEERLRSRAFLVFYLLCGVAGAGAYSLLVLAGYASSGIVGASAGIFGVLVLAALIGAGTFVQLMFLPVTLTMRQLAIIFLVLGAVTVLIDRGNYGGHAGHLGGALAGFLMYKIPALRHLLERLGAKSGGGRDGRMKEAKIVRPKKRRRYERKLRPKSSVSRAEASEVDRILDKINEHGLQSLTDEERQLLTRAGKK